MEQNKETRIQKVIGSILIAIVAYAGFKFVALKSEDFFKTKSNDSTARRVDIGLGRQIVITDLQPQNNTFDAIDGKTLIFSVDTEIDGIIKFNPAGQVISSTTTGLPVRKNIINNIGYKFIKEDNSSRCGLYKIYCYPTDSQTNIKLGVVNVCSFV